MDQQIEQQNKPNSHSATNFWIVIILVFVSALITGGGVFAWQKFNLKTAKQNFKQQITISQNQIATLQKENLNLQDEKRILQEEKKNSNDEIEPITTSSSDTLENVEFPIVVYGSAGLLNNTEKGLIEKKRIEEKLIKPFTDYYNENEVNLITLYITVPAEIGSQYRIQGIFKHGESHGFLFGEREGDYDYWFPDCMGTCNLSEKYKQKYPEIAEIVD